MRRLLFCVILGKHHRGTLKFNSGDPAYVCRYCDLLIERLDGSPY